MAWFQPSNAALARRVPDGPLRRFLAAPAQPRSTPLAEARLLALDLETTGLSPTSNHILSAGLIDVDGLAISLGSASQLLVAPEVEVGQSAVIHALTDDDLGALGVPTDEALDEIFDRLTGRVLLCHHAAVEVGFLVEAVRRRHSIKISIPVVDTLQLGHRLLGVDEDLPADALRLWRLRRRAGLPDYAAHDALTDALAAAELYLWLAAELKLATLRQALS